MASLTDLSYRFYIVALSWKYSPYGNLSSVCSSKFTWLLCWIKAGEALPCRQLKTIRLVQDWQVLAEFGAEPQGVRPRHKKSVYQKRYTLKNVLNELTNTSCLYGSSSCPSGEDKKAGSDLLSHSLNCSTIGARDLNCRVR